MELSIIIPTYNRRKLLHFALESLDAKFHPAIEFEVIVIDDNSTDGTIDFVKSNYPGCIVERNSGKGAATARNQGLAISKGKYILFLDSDDIVGPNFFAEKIAFLNQNTSYDGCYGKYEFFRSDNEHVVDKIIFKHKYSIPSNDATLNYHLVNYLRGSFLPPNAIMWKREILQDCNGYSPDLKINQDVELMFKALLNGAKFTAVNDESYVYVRDHQIDQRVGAATTTEKYDQILAIRKYVYRLLVEKGYVSKHYLEPFELLPIWLLDFIKA